MSRERAPHPREQTRRNEQIWHAIENEEKNGEVVAKEFGLTRARVHQIAAAVAKRKAKAADSASTLPAEVLHAHHTAEVERDD